ncbi:PREDICTED: vitamin K-dependent protein C isoform X2 [Pseudopodoces humilis]|uniref:vitamin K-dependent protein C isoform X2 n=1 Tax=Pseudopodoces humilis TaxID=181119 RepID=UPI0006B7C942|nr:PREDICTED: vitamin K-dependent protein C isoform X2 [Pseudopodoces humilis]
MWKLLTMGLLLAACSSWGFGTSIFYSSKDANQVLRIQKRANTFLEELKPGSVERECVEEICDFEEASEIFETREATQSFWTKYVDGDQCEKQPCSNGICKDDIGKFSCICNKGWEGVLCSYEVKYSNCSVDNGGCEHFCREDPAEQHRLCSCASGYQLKDDHTMCEPVGKFRFRPEADEQTIWIDKWVIHENYTKTTSDNDIAMLHLAEHVMYYKYALPICLPTRNLAEQELMRSGKQMVVTGWGSTSERNTSYAASLRYIEIPIVPRNECAQAMSFPISDNMLCAGSLGDRKDSCSGDSGGPMFTRYKDTWFLVGLVSWGEGCGRREKFGVYTKVSQYLEWIQHHIDMSAPLKG